MYGRKTSRYLNMRKNVLLVPAGSSKAATPSKSPWTQEEKNTFLRGMGIFGRSWSKIASLIPTRTSLQVKNYAQQYMKNLVKKKTEMEKNEIETLKSMTETPLFTVKQSSLAATVASVTTGQPTISVALPAASKLNYAAGNVADKSSLHTAKTKRMVSETKKATSSSKDEIGSIKTQKRNVKNKRFSKLKKSNPTAPNGVVAYADVSETAGANQEADLITFVANKFRNKASRAESICSTSDGQSAINGSSDLSNSSSARELKTSDVEDEDIDVDIDIENEDDENLVLQSRSASPSSVYQQLLRSAHIEQEGTAKIATSLSEATYGFASGDCSDVEDQGYHLDDSDSVEQVLGKVEALSGTAENSPEGSTREKQEDEDPVKPETIVNGLVAATGEVLEFDIPQEERIFQPTTITEEERKVHADFFDGRPPKTPERYLKIRSYILDCWMKSRPVYLNKTCIRPGLKNCGDVNCIGRIHSYLECVGAINFGCEQAAYRNPHRTVGGGTNSRVRGINKDLLASFPVSKSESVRPRKRRIRDETGLWVDERELEGKTVEHNSPKKNPDSSRKTRVPRISKTSYDPFKLVPCQPFSEDAAAPYRIEIFNTALVTMDIHAHISKTEVIGMLGGHFCAGLLTISMAVPCKSMSTGMQCEMDPVSQTLASEQIEDTCMSVVGWYHSHPTFSPDPSVRDIETQQKFQYWFSKGGNHFVGIIISPYNASSPNVYSDIQCLTISKSHSKEYMCNLPFKFDYQIIYRDNLREILGPASELAEKYSNYMNRVMLSCQYRSSLGITCLSKMLQSVKRLLIPPENVTPTDVFTSSASDLKQINSPAPALSSSPTSTLPALSSIGSSTTLQSSSRSKIEEVLHWLEQIFLEKFSQSTPRSPSLSSPSSPPDLPAEQQHPEI